MSPDELARASYTDVFSMEVLSEGHYRVVFSNDGNKKKANPCYVINAQKRKVSCLVCGKPTDSKISLHTNPCKKEFKHTKDWIGVLEPAHITPNHGFYIGLLLNWARVKPAPSYVSGFVYSSSSSRLGFDERRTIRIDDFIGDILNELVGKVLDATEMDRVWCTGSRPAGLSGLLSPEEVVNKAREIVDRHFPKAEFSETVLNGRFGKTVLNDLPLRVVAALLVIAFACEESNRGDLLWSRRFGQKSTRWGAMMAFRLYLAMRYSNPPYDVYVGSAQM